MTVAQTGVVDWLGVEKETGHISLTVVDDLEWVDEHNHLALLQEKLNTYLAFIESGEVFERLLEETGRQLDLTTPIKVRILAKHQLTTGAAEFFDYAKRSFAQAGYELTMKVVVVPQ